MQSAVSKFAILLSSFSRKQRQISQFSQFVSKSHFKGLSKVPLHNFQLKNEYSQLFCSSTIGASKYAKQLPTFIFTARRGYADSNVKAAFVASEVTPDVTFCAPTNLVEVNYKCGTKVELGNTLKPGHVTKQPETVSWNADDNKYYTLAMVDPDAPSRKCPEAREWQHWLVTNIKGGDISTGCTLSEYIGAGPPQKTGLHRYVFLVYEQKSQIDFDEPSLRADSAKGRDKFSIMDFAKKYNLGKPIAGNFFQAEWDISVPKLYKKLGIKA